jgi:purine-binding chemotaxis protein CheW
LPAESPRLEAPALDPARRACVVLLGGRPFAVDVADTREVVVLDATTPVPGAPASVIGVTNLRGGVLPVVEARPLLGLPVRAGDERGRALVLADGDRRAAILIERVLGLVPLEDVRPLTGADGEGLAVGELAAEAGERATLLDARAVLAALRRTWQAARGGSR